MSQTPITVTYSLEEILGEIKQSIKEVNQKLDHLEQKFDNAQKYVDQKFDNLQKEVADLKLGQTELKTQVNNIDQQLQKLEDTQKNQIWTLITLLGGSLIAVGFKAFFMGNNP